ncbi:MAG TPA: hypothetical protein VKC61_20650 [Pyrinomonadaceae bacterium]|nr:hypothetical protein [Pyrinomonadaceae bacterium]
MKNNLLRSLIVLVLFGFVLWLTTWAIASSGKQNIQATQVDSTRRKTLREIARDRDVETEVTEMETTAEYDDLRLLAKHAEAIVVGQIIDEESAFDGEDHILTSYHIEVQSVVKHTQLNAPLGVGAEPPGSLLTPLKLVRPGGVVLLNGHHASSMLKGSEPLKPGRRFLIFLWWSPAYRAYTFAGGLSGAFLIDSDQRLKPLGSKAGFRKHDGDGLQTILDEVLTNP